jgi:rhodanese-related sulfurtransferase/rubrerythrin
MKNYPDPESIQTMYPDEVQSYIRQHPEGEYTLLDVRQPGEYSLSHLPGARLIPLPSLADEASSLDSTRPVIVYCKVGGRSRMAAQLLAGLGHPKVFHMVGGIDAWEDRTASGPREFHLQFVRGAESPEDIIRMAYRMEEGMKRFHEIMRERSSDPALDRLLDALIRAEESHENTLLTLYAELVPNTGIGGKPEPSREAFLSDSVMMEGGLDFERFLNENESFLRDVPGYLDLAMMIETQALDLYLRMAGEMKHPPAAQVLFRIADEEKQHLALLGRYLDGL